MKRWNITRLRYFLPPILALGETSIAFASSTKDCAGNISCSADTEFILILLGTTVLLLLSMLLRLRQMRIRLEDKSKALECSEHLSQLLGEHLPNAIIFQLVFSAEKSFRFTYLSKGYELAFGVKEEDVIQNPSLAYDQVYEADIPLLHETFKRGIEHLEPADLKFRIRDASKKLKGLYLSAIPFRLHGAVIWDGFIQDLSSTKQIGGTLAEENRNVQTLFETIDDFLLVCDMNGQLIHFNSTVKNRLGYTESDLKNRSLSKFFPEESQAEIDQIIVHIQSNKSTLCKLPLQMKNGGLIPVKMNLFQGSWKNKKALFSVARDIANLQQTESALHQSQQMLRLIMDTIPMSVFWKDKDSVYLGCNKMFIRECGLKNISDVVGKSPIDLFNPDQATEVIKQDQDVITNNQPVFGAVQSHSRSDGSIGWRESSKVPLRDDNGRAVGVLEVWTDATERNLAEERLKRTLEDMERFNQLMRGRERRTLELKAEVNALLISLSKPKKYQNTMDSLL